MQPTNELLNTKPAPQMASDSQAVSLTPNDVATSLGFLTNIAEQHAIPPQEAPQEGDITQESAPGQEQTGEVGKDATKEFESFKKEIRTEMKNQIGELKDMIKSALQEDDNEETNGDKQDEE